MGVVVPGRSHSIALQGVGTSTVYGVVGPFASGDYVRRVRVLAWATAVAELHVGMSLGGIGEGSLATFARGVPLISRGIVEAGGIPLIDLFLGAFSGTAFWVPVGIRSSEGARWVIVYAALRTADAAYGLLVGADVLRVERALEGGAA